jgi:16S rRNA (guanine527-N7)-methyltransferase
LRVFAELLRRRLAGIADLSSERIAALEAHYQLMLRWNKALNLTKITELEEAIDRHYMESLFLGAHLPAGLQHIADIGSGAGFPGFPIAILRPDCDIALIESHQRKAVFLREATRDLPNVRVVSKRAEDVAERFDWAVSRAVSYADLGDLLSRLAPRTALLTGAEAPPPEWDCEWLETLAVPRGEYRFLRTGNWRHSGFPS